MKKNYKDWRKIDYIITSILTIGMVAVIIGYSAVLYFDIFMQIIRLIF